VSADSKQQGDQECVFLSTPLTIPNDGSWLQICLVDTSAPDKSTVTETNVKVIVDQTYLDHLEIRLTRTDTDLISYLIPTTITKEGLLFTQIHDFDGLPSQGMWIIQIHSTVYGVEGTVKSISVSSLYTNSEKAQISNSDADGKPTSERIAVDAVKISGISLTEDKVQFESSPEMQMSTDNSVTIMTQTFEGIFPPSTGWTIYDANPGDGKEYIWDDDNLRPYSGYWAAWPARGGANGIDPTLSTTYPTDMDTWMIYGPFDLSNAKSATVAFMLWRHIEVTFDHVFFGISSDGTSYGGWSWDGDVDWESKSYNLSSYLGDNEVWIGWHFVSDGSVQYDGPWIDDITLDFIPKDITVSGNFTYADRQSIMQGANSTKVQLWDMDDDGDDLLATIYADSNGHYTFPTRLNWDNDDTDPILGNRRLDLYIIWILENNSYRVTDLSGNPYSWLSAIYNNINMDNLTISSSLPPFSANYEAVWIFQDIRRTRDFYLNHTSPQSDPGYLTAHWQEYQNSENGINGSHFWALITPHVYIAQNSLYSADTIVHELGHHITWNKTQQWLWYEFSCFDHDIFSQESTQCAWSEGWADYFAVTVNGDVCYDKGIGPCTGVADSDKFDLENHSRNDPNIENSWWGDGVEGRVAGALYDLMDSGNESPWFDTAYWGFDIIADIALVGSGESTFQEFWYSYQGTDKHNGVRSIYQNTIDYDQAPIFDVIPDQLILQNPNQNVLRTHVIDLWDYSSDTESPDASLTYQIVSISDSRCGISLDSHWINADPQINWIGSCYATISVNDSIKTSTSSFWMYVLQINSRIFLPIILKD